MTAAKGDYFYTVGDMRWDTDGSLWFIRLNGLGVGEVLHGVPGGRFETFAELSAHYDQVYFSELENKLYLRKWEDKNTESLSELAVGKPIEWKKYKNTELPGAAQKIVFDADRRGLTYILASGKRQHWKMPAPIMGRSYENFILNIGGQKLPAALLSVSKSSNAVALCKADGSVELKPVGDIYGMREWGGGRGRAMPNTGIFCSVTVNDIL